MTKGGKMKVKFTNKYETYKQKEGTYNKGETKTDRSQSEDSNIYKCLEKYGMQSLINQSMAKEPLYLDNTLNNLDIGDALRQQEQFDEYFEQCPSKVRALFGHNTREAYEKFKRREFDQFLATGMLTEEQTKRIIMEDKKNEARLEENNNNINNTNTGNSEISN